MENHVKSHGKRIAVTGNSDMFCSPMWRKYQKQLYINHESFQQNNFLNVSVQLHWTCSCMTVTHCNWLKICYFTRLALEYTVMESYGNHSCKTFYVLKRSSAVLGVVMSVRPSATRVLCDKTKQCTADILIPRKRTITVVFWHQQWLVDGWWTTPPSVWNLRSKWPTPSKNADFDRFPLITSQSWEIRKSSIVTNRKSTTGFPTDYRWSAYVTHKSPRRVAQRRFLIFFQTKFTSNRLKSGTKFFLCENFQRRSYIITIFPSNGS